ncbi:MAG: helicase SNF2, partial [Planctomycetaceae bacterium]
MSCSCVATERPNPACKHLWATLLAVDSAGLLSAGAKPGSIPPFATESTEPRPLTDYWDGEPHRDVYVPPPGGLRAVRETLVVAPPLKAWQQKLQNLSEQLHSAVAVVSAASREREIYYEIDAATSRDRRQLVLQVTQRQRRSNGQWGKLKPFKLRADRLDEIDNDQDRRLLAQLIGVTPERVQWTTPGLEPATSQRFYLALDLAMTILPELCATGRVSLAAAAHEKMPPLVWDSGPPWELCVEVSTDEAGENWVVGGRLHRGDQSAPLSETRLLLPGGLVVFSDRAARFQDFGAFGWTEILSSERALTVPREDGEALVDRLLDMPQLPRLELPEELRLEEVTAVPRPHLTLFTPRGIRWQHERLTGEVEFEYEGSKIRGTSPQGAIVQRELGRCMVRDRSLEGTAWGVLEGLGARRLLHAFPGRNDIEIPSRALGVVVRGLIREGWQIHADGRQVHQAGPLSFEIRTGIDWFELSATVDFEGRRVAFPELLSALARGDCTVRLDDGSLGVIPEEWLKQFGLLASLGVADGEQVRFSRTQVGLLDALLAAEQSVRFDAGFEELRQRVKQFSGIEPSDPPRGFEGELRPYQESGVAWLKFLDSFGFGGCLAHD